ncbi:MAG TPA: LysM peptidoglycan-binding domain-containing protein [Clostridiaceae bacterium]|nr:LysM peptidoglycan-binding domain-containing protein [Clostridiaceae bacterium]
MRLRIKSKPRFISFLIILMLSVTTLLVAKSVYGYRETRYEYIVVKKGDTLWDISMKYKREEEDVRRYLYELKKINNLETSTLYPGTRLKVIVN